MVTFIRRQSSLPSGRADPIVGPCETIVSGETLLSPDAFTLTVIDEHSVDFTPKEKDQDDGMDSVQ